MIVAQEIHNAMKATNYHVNLKAKNPQNFCQRFSPPVWFDAVSAKKASNC